MKSLFWRCFATLMLTVIMVGCAGVKQESAMEWLQRQPMLTDDPP